MMDYLLEQGVLPDIQDDKGDKYYSICFNLLFSQKFQTCFKIKYSMISAAQMNLTCLLSYHSYSGNTALMYLFKKGPATHWRAGEVATPNMNV